MNYKLLPLLALVPVLLTACGGGSSAPAVTPPVVVDPPPVTPPVTPVEPPVPDWRGLMDHCEHPRQGLGPDGLPYYDVQGTLTDELKWLRSFLDDSYLWYKEIPTNLRMQDYTNVLDYFAVLKTPVITASGRAKDRFHFTYPSEVWEAMSTAGVAVSYGITWSRNTGDALPRVRQVTVVEPGSPAAVAGVQRGDTLQSADGLDLQTASAAELALINGALSPKTAGESHKLVLNHRGVSLPVTLTSAKLALSPVQNVKVLATASGKVGYLQFNEHNGPAEGKLVEAFRRFQTEGVSDLVLDMRYNGGGYLIVASELAYMIAGPAATQGKVFEQLHTNDKNPMPAPERFETTAFGYISAAVKAGTPLPYLNLKRVTVLTTPGTCSASESVINSLRGIDVEVNLIGGETCGKPYAFAPAPNCGTTYFAIQLQGVNNKGFGDYADGFQPVCKVADDLAHELGDTSEALLATALSYRANGVCPVAPMRMRTMAGAMELVRPPVKEIAIRQR